MRKMLATVLVSLVALPTSMLAQEATQPLREAIAREVAQTGQGGAISQPSPSVPSRDWIARHPVQAGFWIGAGAGAVVGAVSCANASEFVGLCMAGGFGAGGGAGAYGGLIASAIGDRRNGRRLSAKTKVGLVAGTVGLVVIGSATRWTFTW